ncbi:thermonuclease family protein [Lysobacter soli]|uniref:thermonuclease family protein n=1 Tax=Lysobacter soli TaxID=453783 RepID=UPI003CE532CE
MLFAFHDRTGLSSIMRTGASGPEGPTGNARGEHMRLHSVQLTRCAKARVNCVVDGDTIWLRGEKIRIADIDTPEVSRPKCRREYELGLAATNRLIELLNEGDFSLARSRWGDEDRFGRKLRLVTRDGLSIGDRLVQEGLAHRWGGRKSSWC